MVVMGRMGPVCGEPRPNGDNIRLKYTQPHGGRGGIPLYVGDDGPVVQILPHSGLDGPAPLHLVQIQVEFLQGVCPRPQGGLNHGSLPLVQGVGHTGQHQLQQGAVGFPGKVDHSTTSTVVSTGPNTVFTVTEAVRIPLSNV